jgi:hypothetical protein
MKQLLDREPPRRETLAVMVAQERLERVPVGLDAVGPEILAHERARRLELLLDERQRHLGGRRVAQGSTAAVAGRSGLAIEPTDGKDHLYNRGLEGRAMRQLVKLTIIVGVSGGVISAFFNGAAHKAGEKLIEWLANSVTADPIHPTSSSDASKPGPRSGPAISAIQHRERLPNQDQVVESPSDPSTELLRPWKWR